MKIKRIVIYGYGKWIDKEFELSSSFQLFYGKNEAGKSTLMSFIHSILFGFPTRHSSLSRYEPRESSRYGGKLIIDDSRFGEVSIERVAGKVTGDVTVLFEDGTTGDERALTTLLYDKNRSFFESIYTFNLKGIENIEEMNGEQLNRHFLSIGALGNEKYLNLADRYKAKASQLFKPTGRKPKINVLASKLEDKHHRVIQAKETNKDYTNYIQQAQLLQEKLQNVEQQEEESSKELSTYKELTRKKESIQEIQQLTEDLKKTPELNLPDDGLYQLKHINEEINGYRHKVEELQMQQKELQEEYRPSNDLLIYQAFEEELKSFSKELDYWQEKVQTTQFHKQEQESLKNQLVETKIRENLPLNESVPKELTPQEWDDFVSLKKALKRLGDEVTQLETDIERFNYRIEANNEMIDTIEKNLWPLEKFKKMKEKSEFSNKKVVLNSKEKKRGIGLALVISIVSISLAALMSQPVFLVGVGLAILIGFIGSKKETETLDFSSEEIEEFYNQQNLRTQWKEMLTSNDVLQEEQREKETLFLQLKNEKQGTEDSFLEWKKQTGHPLSLNVAEIEKKQPLFHSLRKMTEQIDALHDTIKVTTEELTERLHQLSSLEAIVNDELNSMDSFEKMRRFIKQVENELDSQKEYVKKTEQVQRDIGYFVRLEKESGKRKYRLLESVGALNDEDMYKLYQNQEERKHVESRLTTLRENLPDLSEEQKEWSLDKIDDQIKNLETHLEELKKEKTHIIREMMEVERAIKNLEEGGTYSELLQEFENEKSVYQDKVNEWSALNIAASLIEKTLQHAKEDKLPHTIQKAETFFSYLTDGEYSSILVEDDALFVLNQEGVKWNVKELSRGTVEPLYIALRLAFIQNTKDSIRFPIIIDDSFVNLDLMRLEKMYHLLLEVSKDTQIIYFTFDQTIQSYITPQHCTQLNEE